jgi:hypothetical protein
MLVDILRLPAAEEEHKGQQSAEKALFSNQQSCLASTACICKADGTSGALQVSPGGAYVATYDKHSLHIWATRHGERRPLTLHHTKAFTVRPFQEQVTILSKNAAQAMCAAPLYD